MYPPPVTDEPVRGDLVLVGGGHAHVQVLRAWAAKPLPGVQLSVVVDDPIAVYSGMVPGFVAGQYPASELEIDLRPLARRAGARFVVAPAAGIDLSGQRVELVGRPPLRFDVASLDVGSRTHGTTLPGVTEHALATRPMARFVRGVEALLEEARRVRRFRLAVVGGGAGGVELALAFRARLAREGVPEIAVTLLDAAPRVLPNVPEPVSQSVEDALAARGIELVCGVRVLSIEPDADARRLRLSIGATLSCDAVVWVAGGEGPPWLAASKLPTDAAGFVRVRPTLEVEGRDDLFAVGDCAAFDPPLAKAGVYAVRQGPLLARNLRARLQGQRLRRYRPQRDALALLNLGDGTALGTKWGRVTEGRPLFALKDWIDRRFMRRFQVLRPDGLRSPGFGPRPGESERVCGGSAAKVAESTLARALSRLPPRGDAAVLLGLGADDAAVVKTRGGELVVASIDALRAFVDDPWLLGRVAAVAAASDLWAKGAAPRFALAQVTVPDRDPGRAEETLYQVLAGARACFDAEGVSLVGGDTTAGAELSVGFAIWGSPPVDGALLRIGGLAAGDRLLMTKPLGTGVLFAADLRGLARGAWIEAAVASMLRPNAAAACVARELGASACTDVSGFGLAGHLGQMLRASKAKARLALGGIPLLPGARECLGNGIRSSFHRDDARIRRSLRVERAAAGHPAFEALFDPQTSGGLLFGVPAARADQSLARLHEAGDEDAACIGEVLGSDPEASLELAV